MNSRTTRGTVKNLLLAALFVVGGAATWGMTPMALAPGDKAPQLSGYPLGERKHVVVDWGAARFTLVNFWATWCAPCRQEIPTLQGLFAEHAGDGLGIIGVYDQNSDESLIGDFLGPFNVTYPIIKAFWRVDRDWGGIHAWPTSFLVRQDGTILRRYVGAAPDQIEGMVSDIKAVLEGRQMGPLVMPKTPEAATAADRVEQKRKMQGLDADHDHHDHDHDHEDEPPGP